MKIGIVGNGYVGKATALLECEDIEVIIFDIDPEKCKPLGLDLADLKTCDYIFICVPTPMTEDGEPVLEIVDNAIASLDLAGCDRDRVIIKSTVPIGTCKDYGVMFMPEFLTEKKWEDDFKSQKNWILGTNDRDDKVRDDIYNIFTLAYKNGAIKNSPNLLYCDTKEAEAVKYARNCYLATKVSFFNEIHSFCLHKSMDFDKVRELTCLDDRIEDSHTHVPGPDGFGGYGGTCFPKDMNSLLYQIKRSGAESYVIKAAVERNEKEDRPEKDWRLDVGRAVI